METGNCGMWKGDNMSTKEQKTAKAVLQLTPKQ